MQKQDHILLLRERILLLEVECGLQNTLLKEQFKTTIESLKPMNVIKGAVTSIIKNNVVDTAIGLSSGYLVKKSIVRSSKNPFLKMLGALVGMGVANVMAKHPEGIKTMGSRILNSFFKGEMTEPEKQNDH